MDRNARDPRVTYQIPRVVAGFPDRRGAQDVLMLATWQESAVFVRQEDLCDLQGTLEMAAPEAVRTVHAEIVGQPSAPLLQNTAWTDQEAGFLLSAQPVDSRESSR